MPVGNLGTVIIKCNAVSSVFWRWAQSLQWEVDAVSSLSARLFSSLCPVSAFVSVLSEFFGRLISISCALSLSLVRLKIGAQSSLMLLFCQFAISLVFMSFTF